MRSIVSGVTKDALGLTVHFYPVQEMKKQKQNWPAMSSKLSGIVIFTESEFTLGSCAIDRGKFSQAQ